MALNLANVQTTDTFQTWYTRTNEILRDAFPTSGGTITGNLTVTGNASFIGNTTLVSVTELTSRDAILHLGANNASDIIDMGVVTSYVRGDGQNTHAGFIRDSGTKEIYFLDEAGTGQAGQPFNSFDPNAADTVLANVHVRKLIGATATLSGTVTASAFVGDGSQLTNAGSTVSDETNSVVSRQLLVPFTGVTSGTMTSANVDLNFSYNSGQGVLSVNSITSTLTGNVFGNVTGTVSSLSNHDTDDLSEGATNLYYTDARAQAAITGGTGVTVTTGEVAIGQAVATSDDVEFNSVTTSALKDSSSRTLTIRDESGTIVWGG